MMVLIIVGCPITFGILLAADEHEIVYITITTIYNAWARAFDVSVAQSSSQEASCKGCNQ